MQVQATQQDLEYPLYLGESSLPSLCISHNFSISPSLSQKAGNLQESTAVFGWDIHSEVFARLKTIFKYFHFSKEWFCSKTMAYVYENGLLFDILPR